MERGDFVTLSRDDDAIVAMVTLVSDNRRSVMLMFDGAFAGHYGSIPVLMDDDGVYRSIADHRVVTITPEA